MTKSKRYKRYSAEFKREALRRAAEEGMRTGLSAKNLGLARGSSDAGTERSRCWGKRERVNRICYRTRDEGITEARADLFEYFEVFYNRKRRRGYIGNVCPADFEERSAGSFETVH